MKEQKHTNNNRAKEKVGGYIEKVRIKRLHHWFCNRRFLVFNSEKRASKSR